MFPGQGSQYIGMGKEFYEQIPICKEVYDLASEVTGLDIPALCFEENEKINITEYTQICMLATEAAIYMALEQNGYQPDVTAGLSLGEYGALIASGVMTAEEAFELVRKRGIFMQEAVPAGGAMAAVLGLDAAAIEQICRDTAEQTGSEVSIANYNCPGQIVISGQEEAVHLAGETCKASGAKRVVPLKVSGPFHSKMLQGAGEKLKEELLKINIQKVSYDNMEHSKNIKAVAVPILDKKNRIIAAISCPCFPDDLTDEKSKFLVKEMQKTCEEISKRLEYFIN